MQKFDNYFLQVDKSSMFMVDLVCMGAAWVSWHMSLADFTTFKVDPSNRVLFDELQPRSTQPFSLGRFS